MSFATSFRSPTVFFALPSTCLWMPFMRCSSLPTTLPTASCALPKAPLIEPLTWSLFMVMPSAVVERGCKATAQVAM